MKLAIGSKKICGRYPGREVCRSIVYIMFGPSTLYFDELFHTIINHIPAGASYRQLVHYAQIAAARKCQSCVNVVF